MDQSVITQTRGTPAFWQRFPEKEELNQYWYSENTIATLAKEAIKESPERGGRIAFLSTPSVYFATQTLQKNKSTQHQSYLFDFDPKFTFEGERFVLYDFNKPEDVSADIASTFDFVVVDPPFITREVWELYAKTIKLLLRSKHSKVLLTTIEENATMIYDLFGCRLRAFKPCIPHLVYQYALFTNYESSSLNAVNPEIDEGY